MKRIGLASFVLLVILPVVSSQQVFAQWSQGDWIGTWGTTSYTQSATSPPQSNGNFTYRNVVRVSAGGTSVRVKLTNEFGTGPLTVGPIQVAISAGNGAIQPGTNMALTFSGSPLVTIPTGAVAYSDALTFAIPPLTSLTISAYFPPQTIARASCHPNAQATNYFLDGNAVAQQTQAGYALTQAFCYLRSIDVNNNGSPGSAIVALGDSITNGYQSAVDGNKRYTDYLAANLQGNGSTVNVGVLNKGIVGNELLGQSSASNAPIGAIPAGGYGPPGMARLAGDVFSETGVEYLIVLEGSDDLGYSSGSMAMGNALIAGYQQLIAQAHNQGIWVYGGTLTPDYGSKYFPTNDDAARQAVNAWIRTSGAFDAVIDFDELLSNGAVSPAIPALQTQYDSGDHLHPSAAGYQAMANAISLSLFNGSHPLTKGGKPLR